jgi:hypothetical protein
MAGSRVDGVAGRSREPRGLGVWYDDFIAVGTPYVDVLVSDDRNQRRRVEFLRERGLVGFRAQSLEEFIGAS